MAKARFIPVMLLALGLMDIPTAQAYALYAYGAGYKDRGSLEYDPVVAPVWAWNTRTLTYRFDTSVLGGLGYTNTDITTLTGKVQDQLKTWDPWGSFSFPAAPVENGERILFKFFDNATECSGSNTDNGTTQQHSTVNLGARCRNSDGSVTRKFTDGADLTNLFGTIALHEVGHVLGLGDLYGPAIAGRPQGPYEDFVDHGLNQRRAPSAVGKNDDIMQTLDGIIDNDEIAGVTWGWGEQFNQIVTGRLGVLDGFGVTTQNQHHGPDQNPPETWYYRGTVETANASITIDAVGAYAAGAVDPGVWTTQIFPDHVVFTGAPAPHGNFEFFVKSKNREGFIKAQVDTSLFDLAIDPSGLVHSVVSGVEHWPVVYGPVPEPSPFALIATGLALVVGVRAWRQPA
jgi:hypothetical protein